MLMHDSGYENSVGLDFVKEAERKARNQAPTDIRSLDGAGFRRLPDALSRLLDRCEKVETQTFGFRFVEAG